MRRTAKRAVERFLVLGGFASVGRAFRRGSTLILAYHNVLPEGVRPAGDTSLHLSVTEFRRQLEALTHTHDVVPLSAIREHGSRTKPRVVITFDDAYLGALTAGVGELGRLGLPATVFAAPGLFGTHTWWDLMSDPRLGAVPDALRDRALVQYGGNGGEILREIAPMTTPDELGPALRIATESELRTATNVSGINVACHTWNHVSLPAVAALEAERELRQSGDWLRSRFERYLPWVSYPYGLHDARTERLAEDAGFDGALKVDGGWMGATALRAYAVPRFNVPAGLSLDGFRLRVAGIASS